MNRSFKKQKNALNKMDSFMSYNDTSIPKGTNLKITTRYLIF